jgi:hypothetical protein
VLFGSDGELEKDEVELLNGTGVVLSVEVIDVIGDTDVLLLEEVFVESEDVSVVLLEDTDKELDDALVDIMDSELRDEELLMVEESVDVVVRDTVLLREGVDVKLESEFEEVAVVVALIEEGNDETLTEEEELVDSMLEVGESPA